MQNRRGSGFTLVEVLVAVALFSILLSLAVPSFRDMIDRNAVSTTASNLLSSLFLARSEAVKRERQITFSIEDDGWSVQDDGRTLAENMPANGVAVSQGTFYYDSRGQARNNGNLVSLDFSVVRNNAQRHVCVGLGGRPRIQKGVCL